MREDQLATEAEIKEAIAQGQKQAADEAAKTLASKATSEIMGAADGEEPGPPPLKDWEFPFPDPPPDALVIAMHDILLRVQEKVAVAGEKLDRDDLHAEIIERFGQAGILIWVKWFETNIANTYLPEIEPYGVTTTWSWAVVGHPNYDPDRQVFDVTNDTMGTGEKGVIGGKSSGLWTPGGP